MGDNNNRRLKKASSYEVDEVEQLLRQTQDDILLKLTINSHTTSSSIDPDLDRRFTALKSNNKNNKQPIITPPTPPVVPTQTTTSTDNNDDDLFARFSALKNNNKIKKSSGSSKDSFVEKQLKLKEFEDVDCGEEKEEDEVEKLIKWAVDAARLDPSPPSDDDEEEDEESDEDSDSDDDDVNDNGKKCKRK